MIENPQTITEQVLNLVERIATEMRALLNTINTKLGKDEKAASAVVADTAASATKAVQDGEGNIITETYINQEKLDDALTSKSDVGHVHITDQIIDLDTTLGSYATKEDLESLSSEVESKVIVSSINGIEPDENGNIVLDFGGVKTVNGNSPDSEGNITAEQTGCLPLTGGTVSGTILASSFQATSDARLKEELTVQTYDLSSLKAYRYRLITDQQYHVGLLAQEVEKVIPEAVSEDEEGYLSVDYNAVVASLVAKVNELSLEVMDLKARIRG